MDLSGQPMMIKVPTFSSSCLSLGDRANELQQSSFPLCVVGSCCISKAHWTMAHSNGNLGPAAVILRFSSSFFVTFHCSCSPSYGLFGLFHHSSPQVTVNLGLRVKVFLGGGGSAGLHQSDNNAPFFFDVDLISHGIVRSCLCGLVTCGF